jgi:4-hydroxy-L-threonine phosphate dehydrogenase PdxA
VTDRTRPRDPLTALAVTIGKTARLGGEWALTVRHERSDALLRRYQDRTLPPLKTIDLAEGVTTLVGLPPERTPPDHGTASTDSAAPSNLIAARRTAHQTVINRSAAARA